MAAVKNYGSSAVPTVFADVPNRAGELVTGGKLLELAAA